MPLQHPVPESHLAAIGDITVSFALLESLMCSLTHDILESSHRIGQIVTAELAFKNIRALAISLFLELHGETTELSTLRLLMKRAATLEEKRNQITHSLWAVGDTTETITRIKTTAKEAHGIRHQFEQMSVDDLRALAALISELAEDIQSFHIAHMARAQKR